MGEGGSAARGRLAGYGAMNLAAGAGQTTSGGGRAVYGAMNLAAGAVQTVSGTGLWSQHHTLGSARVWRVNNKK